MKALDIDFCVISVQNILLSFISKSNALKLNILITSTVVYRDDIWGTCGQGLKVPKLSQTKVFDKKSENFRRPVVGPVKKPQFLAFSRVS